MDIYHIRRRWENKGYGGLQDFIDFESAITIAARSFEDSEIWTHIDGEISYHTSADFLQTLNLGIIRFIHDLRSTELGDWLNEEVLGYNLVNFTGSLYIFKAFYYE